MRRLAATNVRVYAAFCRRSFHSGWGRVRAPPTRARCSLASSSVTVRTAPACHRRRMARRRGGFSSIFASWRLCVSLSEIWTPSGKKQSSRKDARAQRRIDLVTNVATLAPIRVHSRYKTPTLGPSSNLRAPRLQKMSHLLTQPRDARGVAHSVSADQGQSFAQSLCHNQTVKRIAVMARVDSGDVTEGRKKRTEASPRSGLNTRSLRGSNPQPPP
ncbi:hypothetical protein BH20VER1_BH20VER1_22000 [soil metagenome]